jgi:hypothetical protein
VLSFYLKLSENHFLVSFWLVLLFPMTAFIERGG